MSLHSRLQRLERHVDVPSGCPDCWGRRGRTVLVEARALPEGTVRGAEEEMPKPCATCGEVPEQVCLIERVVVEWAQDGSIQPCVAGPEAGP